MMKIACLCPTYNRPMQLAEAIECFNRQTYPLEKRELIILDDAGQYEEESGPGWHLVSTRKRFRTLGEKRNTTAALVSADVEAYALWDDDDIYLPWHLEEIAKVLATGVPWCKPDAIWQDKKNRLQYKPIGYLFHACWGLTRELFLSVGGNPAMQSGQDQGLCQRLRKSRCRHAAPAAPPSFIYRWHTYAQARHLSAMGQGGYERRGEEVIVRQEAPLQPAWTCDWTRLAAEAIAQREQEQTQNQDETSD